MESELVFSSQLEPDLATEGLYAIGSSITTISPIGVERYEQSAFNISEQFVHFLQESDSYPDLFFNCSVSSLNLDCAQTGLEKQHVLYGEEILLKLKPKISMCF